MEFDIKKEHKKYASGSSFYIDTYQNKLTKVFRSEATINIDVINRYISNPLDIENLIEEFTVKLLDRENKRAFTNCT